MGKISEIAAQHTAWGASDRMEVSEDQGAGSWVTKYFLRTAFAPLTNLGATMQDSAGVAGTVKAVASNGGPWTPTPSTGNYIDITGTTSGFVVNAMTETGVIHAQVPQAVAAGIDLSAYVVRGTPEGAGNSVLHLSNTGGTLRAVWF